MKVVNNSSVWGMEVELGGGKGGVQEIRGGGEGGGQGGVGTHSSVAHVQVTNLYLKNPSGGVGEKRRAGRGRVEVECVKLKAELVR